MTDVVGALFGSEQVQGAPDEIPEGVDGSGLGLPQQLFEFGECHLDRIEIWRVLRQIAQFRTDGFDRFFDAGDHVGPQIIHHDDIAAVEYGSQALLNISQKDFSIHGSVNHQWRRHCIAAQARHERQRLPGSERHAPEQSLATRAATIQTSHVGVHRCFVNEDKTGRIKQALLSDPAPARTGHVRSVLLERLAEFF